MIRRTLAIALAVGLSGTTVQAQVHRQPSRPTNFNNPLQQATGFGAGANNPLMQGNGFGTGANNPLMQGNGFGTGFNNPLMQANGFGGGFNNPLMQANGFGGGFNNPLTQGNFNGFGAANNSALMPNGLNPMGNGVVGNGRNNANVSAALNGGTGSLRSTPRRTTSKKGRASKGRR
jgi:hypothetical protein